MNVTAPDLSDLARQIAAEHAAAEGVGADSLEHARRAGVLLIQAREQCPHGAWLPWLGDNFPGSRRTASLYIQVAERWTEIEPNWQRAANFSLRAAVKLLNSIDAKAAPAVEPADSPEPVDLPAKVSDLSVLLGTGTKFGCIMADPPWKYGNQATRASTDNHYATMTVDELAALPVGELAAERSHLWLWTTNGFLFECPKLFDAWGFEFKSSYVWVKPQIGIGNYLRNAHEFLLLATRGGLVGAAKDVKSWGEFRRTAHSAKPDEIRTQVVERVSPGPRLELFGRRKAPGWTVFGNQIETDLWDKEDPEAA